MSFRRIRLAGIAAIAVFIAAGTTDHPGAAHHGTAAAAIQAAPVAASSNEALANHMAVSYGWTAGNGQTGCLDKLWARETGGTWDPLITDPLSAGPGGPGAFGIAQALDHGGTGTSAVVTIHYLDGTSVSGVTVNEYPGQAANAGNAAAQIGWGLGDIRDVYGNPCNSWAHEEANGWY